MMFIDLNNLKIECKDCGVLTPVTEVRHWHETTWIVPFACKHCKEVQTEQENKAIEDNYEDFVKNEESEKKPRGRGGGRPFGSKDSAPRAICRCSRCGARGRRISSLRGGRCIECEFLEVV